MPRGCIIYCAEKGQLEKYTILSILSVKRFGGFLSQYDVFCFQPRKEFPVSAKTKKKLAELNVVFIDKPLNTTHRYYSFANKSIVCDYMANTYDYDQYIFYDSDTLILDEPTEYINVNSDMLMCPVYTKGLGINESDNENKAYWFQLFKVFGILPRNLPTVETAFEHEKIVAYWNAGIIVLNKRKEIFQRWNELLLQLLDQRNYPPSGIFFVEQISLAITLIANDFTVRKLPQEYNFPLDQRILNTGTTWKFDAIKILHHLNNLHLLDESDFVNSGNLKIQWVKEKIIELGIQPKNPWQKIHLRILQVVKEFKERLYYFIFKFTHL